MTKNYFMFEFDFAKAHDRYLDKIAHADEYEQQAADNYAAMLKRDQQSEDSDYWHEQNHNV